MNIKTYQKDIGERILQCRKSLGLTQEVLAEMADLTPQAISLYECGKRAMRFDSVLKLAVTLNTSADYLLTGTVIDVDRQIFSSKLDRLTAKQLKTIETIVDGCISLCHQSSI